MGKCTSSFPKQAKHYTIVRYTQKCDDKVVNGEKYERLVEFRLQNRPQAMG